MIRIRGCFDISDLQYMPVEFIFKGSRLTASLKNAFRATHTTHIAASDVDLIS